MSICIYICSICGVLSEDAVLWKVRVGLEKAGRGISVTITDNDNELGIRLYKGVGVSVSFYYNPSYLILKCIGISTGNKRTCRCWKVLAFEDRDREHKRRSTRKPEIKNLRLNAYGSSSLGSIIVQRRHHTHTHCLFPTSRK
jgi:hypothetical protein